jgi:hypothetical protein
MKKIFIGILLLILIGASSVFAKPTRITFRKGATKAVVNGRLNSYKSKLEYVIRLREGQTLKLSSNKYITLAIADPTGEDVTDHDASCNGNKTVSPSVAGDYKIIVVECRKADAWRGNFKLFVSAR